MAANVGFTTARSRVKLQEGVLQVLVNLHDGSLVATAVAVIWRTENRHDIAILAPVVALKKVVEYSICRSISTPGSLLVV